MGSWSLCENRFFRGPKNIAIFLEHFGHFLGFFRIFYKWAWSKVVALRGLVRKIGRKFQEFFVVS